MLCHDVIIHSYILVADAIRQDFIHLSVDGRHILGFKAGDKKYIVTFVNGDEWQKGKQVFRCFWLFHILIPYNIILYFRLPNFNVSNSALIFTYYFSTLILYRRSVDTLYHNAVCWSLVLFVPNVSFNWLAKVDCGGLCKHVYLTFDVISVSYKEERKPIMKSQWRFWSKATSSDAAKRASLTVVWGQGEGKIGISKQGTRLGVAYTSFGNGMKSVLITRCLLTRIAEFDNMQHGNSTRGRRCCIEMLSVVKFLYPRQHPGAN